MKKLFNFTLALIFTASLLGLASCNGIPGAESGDLPPGPPFLDTSSTIIDDENIESAAATVTSVTGFVVDDAISGANINVYAFDNGVRGELLASTTTASDGSYSVEIDGTESRPILFEARGGSYIELATGQQVELKEDEVLKAVAIYQPGQPLSIMVTPLTHLVAALVEYQLASGLAVTEAITSASAEINELFGFDVAATYPRSISELGSDTDLTAERQYAFFLSALSSWTKQASEQNNLAPHAVYNSIYLSQVLYKEVASDGLLDGKAKNSDSDSSSVQALGRVNLGPNTYRISLAQHMLAMAASSVNVSGITVEQLLPLAFRFLNSQHRLFAGVPIELSSGEVEVSVKESADVNRRDVFEYAFSLSSPELVSRVIVSVDDFELPVLIVPGDLNVPIDTRQFEDGDHTVTIVAKDWLGNTVATHSSEFKFDNTNPFINVTSELYTKEQSYRLLGTVEDNGSGIDKFEIEDQTITPSPDNSWSFDPELEPGNNIVLIRLTDLAGNEFSQEINVALDQTAPVVDASAGHSPARFSNELGEIVLSSLTDINGENSVYLESDKLDLDGVSINRQALQGNGIPYFAFKASDPVVGGFASSNADLDVRMTYEKNGTPLSELVPLSPIDGEYLVPLASETLHSSWHQTVKEDVHLIRIRVTDQAGNVGEKVFSFKADIVVSDFVVEQGEDLNKELFDETEFSQRDSLYGMQFDSIQYFFTNDTGKSMYVEFEDIGVHKVKRLIEKKVRENFVREVVTTEWQAELILNVTTMCDNPINPIKDDPIQIFQIENYTGGQWVTEFIPPPVISEVDELAFTDVLPHPIGTQDWQPLAFDDNDFYDGVTSNEGISDITYKYDYVLSKAPVDKGKPAFVDDIVVDYLDGPIISCLDPVNGLFERTVYSYESKPGYPKNVLTNMPVDEQSVSKAGLIIYNETDQAQIDPINGWYQIPTGHTVKIIKSVSTPVLNISNDVEVDGPDDEFSSYDPRFYDKSITWCVDRSLKINARHDTGFDNISVMTTKEFNVGKSKAGYKVSRDLIEPDCSDPE